jgi:hypothetical protein
MASGTHIGEHTPMMANALDKATLIRSMSYMPSGRGMPRPYKGL